LCIIREMSENKVPLCRPEIGEKEIEEIKRVLDSGWLAHGPKVKEFEKKFAEYIGVKYAVSLNSCASALQAAIMAKNLKGEIILPSFTFPASANAIINAGCIPVFAEIRKDTMNIDISDVEKKITLRTVGIMPVHFAGQSCEMDKIMELAKKHNMTIIEDSAEAIGTTYTGKKTGAFGEGCFSFYPTKNITTAEGGMVTTNSKETAEMVQTIRGHGVSKGAYEREHAEKPWIRMATMPGYNFRMNEIQAVLGIEQLKILDELNEKRRKNAQYLNRGLSRYREITTPYEDKKGKHTYQMYVIQLDEKIDRDAFVIYLRNNGVEANVHFFPGVHQHPYYEKTFGKKSLPVTESISRIVATLPMFPSMTKKQMDIIIEKVGEALKTARWH